MPKTRARMLRVAEKRRAIVGVRADGERKVLAKGCKF